RMCRSGNLTCPALFKSRQILAHPMRFSFLVVITALTASMSVDATPAAAKCRPWGSSCTWGIDCCDILCGELVSTRSILF
ncbi:hypothetical protein EDB19DRAFT_1685670, partial [Suillus lakei]